MKIAIIGRYNEAAKIAEQIETALNAETGSEEKGYLVALNFELPADGTLPKRITIIPPGPVVQGRDGREWRNDYAQRLCDHLNSQARDVVLDYEHATELKAPKGEKAPAAGWLNDFALDDKGAVTAAINTWTPDGEQAVKNKEYRYISPAIDFAKSTRQIIGISSVALTNKPNFHVPALNHQEKENTMPLEELLKLLGLAPDATIEQAMNAVQKLQGDLETALNRENVPDLQKFVPRADYNQQVERATNAEQKLADRDQADQETAVNAEIDAALKAGKIAPASKDTYVAMCRQENGLELFKQLMETAPVIAKDSGLDKKERPDGDGKALNAEEKKIASMFGNSAEDLKKYGQDD